jgi:hypothetical protein
MGTTQVSSNQLTTKEMACLSLASLVLAIAIIGLAYGIVIPQHSDYHGFADQRNLLNLPFAADVLSNLPFAFVGIYGLVLIGRINYSDDQKTQISLFCLSFIGLSLTTAASGFYHFAPNNYGLSIDRLGMTSAFAGVIGLAIASRISDRAGLIAAFAILILAPFSIAHWYQSDNLWLWSVFQGGGLVALALLALCPAAEKGIRIQLGWIIALYVLAKILEVSDHPIYDWSQQTVSGHSLKHLAAAAAAWPLIKALRQQFKIN